MDPTGRQLDLLMPRYRLNDEDVGHLVAYLKSLFTESAPGVDASTIHFATVVCDGVPDAKRQAMMEVLNAYVRRKNADTQGKLNHPGFSPLYKDEFQGAFRKWELHVWELHGPPETWGDQLEIYYQRQPVFALLSGMSAGSWSLQLAAMTSPPNVLFSIFGDHCGATLHSWSSCLLSHACTFRGVIFDLLVSAR